MSKQSLIKQHIMFLRNVNVSISRQPITQISRLKTPTTKLFNIQSMEPTTNNEEPNETDSQAEG